MAGNPRRYVPYPCCPSCGGAIDPDWRIYPGEPLDPPKPTLAALMTTEDWWCDDCMLTFRFEELTIPDGFSIVEWAERYWAGEYTPDS